MAIAKSNDEWKRRLTPQQFHVLREKGTEAPFTGEFDQFFEPGVYKCAACGAELFSSETKFDAGCGWPSFYEALDKSKVNLTNDDSHGMRRIEVTCKNCDGHLGHVFDDGPQPTGKRYCINSAALNFKKE